ncbi:S-adenosyl-L-methionine-dependent methyltransferase [Phaeosphaeriaceae sp. SRC1lsM3a]|nr:S-adenosyl-L-methionine-dependent methyltransferase [Stagonospora sp. SRC1lsM3a]
MVDDHERVSIHGRIFQKVSVDEKIYCAPVADDDIEEDRLAAQHSLFFRLLGDSLISPAIRLREPDKVLDCGYGGGDWSVDFAEEFEDCEVTGIDLYPMELPVHQPDNLELFAYNMNDRLNDTEVFQSRAYDLIHSRCVAPGIKKNRWPSYFRDMRVLLRPGGWVQAAEYHMHVQSNSGSLTVQSAVYRWWLNYAQAMAGMNRDPRVGPRLQEFMAAAGLRDVQHQYIRMPIGGWDPNPSQSRLGRDAVGVVGDMLESLGLWPFTSHLGWSFAQFTQLMQAVRAELQNDELRLYIPM